MLIDGHLDLAMNAAAGRDLTLSLEALRASDPVMGQRATVTFPELRAADVRVCFGTLFAENYADAQEARAQALSQWDQYQRWQDSGHIRLLSSGAQLRAHLAQEGGPLGVVLLMEGADPLRDPGDLPFWVERGLRVIGPAWGRTRYAGGTDQPGPLTPLGHELVQAIKDLGLTLDASHLDEAAFWEAAQLGPKLIATHANSRRFVSGNRHLTDEMARAIAQAGGVIGLVMLGRFIQDGWSPQRPTTLAALVRHAEHYAACLGWEHVALGTDMDGGFGAEKMPQGVERYRDVLNFVEMLPTEARSKVAWQNWAAWLENNL